MDHFNIIAPILLIIMIVIGALIAKHFLGIPFKKAILFAIIIFANIMLFMIVNRWFRSK